MFMQLLRFRICATVTSLADVCTQILQKDYLFLDFFFIMCTFTVLKNVNNLNLDELFFLTFSIEKYLISKISILI